MMSEETFQVGDVVRLKSGGLDMNIEKIDVFPAYGNESRALCVWFDSKGELKRECFVPATLKKVEKKPVTLKPATYV